MQVVQKLRQKYPLTILLELAQLPRSTFYYQLKRMDKEDKYKEEKAAIASISNENKGRNENSTNNQPWFRDTVLFSKGCAVQTGSAGF